MTDDADAGFFRNLSGLATDWVAAKRKNLASTTPQTEVDQAGASPTYSFSGQDLTFDDLQQIKDIREGGGQVAQLMHSKALLNFGEGAEFTHDTEDGDPETEVVDGTEMTLTEWLELQFPHLDLLVLDLGEDALWYPYAVGEMLETRGGDFKEFLGAEPWTLLPETNSSGEIVRWHQQVKRDGKRIQKTLPADDLESIVLNKRSARDKVGISEVLRNDDEIRAFKENEQAINQAIELHGFPQRHVKVGKEDGAPLRDNDLRRVRTIFDPHTTDANTAYFTGQDVDVETLEAHQFDYTAIHEMDMRNLTTALGLPLEAGNVGSDGLGSGKPAELRFALLKLNIKANQRSFATQFIEQVVRPAIRDYSPFSHTADVGLRIDDPLEDIGEVADLINSVGDYMTNEEARSRLDLPAPDDDETAESYRSPADLEKDEAGVNDDPMGGLFGERAEEAVEQELAGRDLTASTARTLQEDFEASLFELVATDEQEDFTTGDRLGVGVDFPNSGVYVDWNIAAWPEDERLDGPHVSEYATVEDARTVAQGEVRELSAGELPAGDSRPFDHRCLGEGITDQQLGHAPEWDRPLLEMYRGVSNPESDPSRTLVSFASSETPEFVLERIREAIMSGSLFSDIDGISGDELMSFRQEFSDALAQDDFTLEGVADTIQEFTGESQEKARVAARTELGNTLKQAREDGYEERGQADGLFYWSGELDGRQTDTCAYLMAGSGAVGENPGAFSGLPHSDGTNPFEGGTPLPMDELKEHVQRVARADPEISTEPRTWTPHIQCRSQFVLAPPNWRDL